MDRAPESLDAPDGAVASALVRVLLESRRELLNAIAMTQALIRENAMLRWRDDERFALSDLELAGATWVGDAELVPELLREPALTYARRAGPSRNGLRLVLSTNSHTAPTGDTTHEHRYDRG